MEAIAKFEEMIAGGAFAASSGENQLIHAYMHARERGISAPVFHGGCLFEKDVTGIVAAAEAAGIQRIHLACLKTGLIEILA